MKEKELAKIFDEINDRDAVEYAFWKNKNRERALKLFCDFIEGRISVEELKEALEDG
jgi:hypothetical protein